MADNNKEALRALKIKTGVMTRVKKELAMYQKEVAAESEKLKTMQSEGRDAHDIKQQVCVCVSVCLLFHSYLQRRRRRALTGWNSSSTATGLSFALEICRMRRPAAHACPSFAATRQTSLSVPIGLMVEEKRCSLFSPSSVTRVIHHSSNNQKTKKPKQKRKY